VLIDKNLEAGPRVENRHVDSSKGREKNGQLPQTPYDVGSSLVSFVISASYIRRAIHFDWLV
jgi:hypothetical protein